MTVTDFRAPQLAKASKTVPVGPSWVSEDKLDGYRVVAAIEEDGIVLRSRTGNRFHQTPYIEGALRALPAGTVLDGELVDLSAAGGNFNRTASVLKRNETQRVSAANPPLTYVAFDILALGGEDVSALPLRSRRALLETAFAHESLQSEVLGVRLTTISAQRPSSEEAFDAAIEAGFEGVVCKHLDRGYEFGERSWIKIKPDAEVEAVCTGTYEPKSDSKYDGRAVGGITFHLVHEDGREYDGRCAGKMDDRLREDLLANPGRYVGLVVEIGHWGVGEDGALRHPSFRRFREDKAADEVNRESAPAREPSLEPQKSVRGADLFMKRSAPEDTPAPKPKAKRMRNYGAMKPDKLRRVRDELVDAIESGANNEARAKASDDLLADFEAVAAAMAARDMS